MEDLSLIKVALEYAQFKDWRIREGVNNAIKALDLDLVDVGFGASVETKAAFEELQNSISDVETLMDAEIPSDNDDDDDDDIPVLEEDNKEDDDDKEDELELENGEDEDDEVEGELELDEEEEEIEEDKTQQS